MLEIDSRDEDEDTIPDEVYKTQLEMAPSKAYETATEPSQNNNEQQITSQYRI